MKKKVKDIAASYWKDHCLDQRRSERQMTCLIEEEYCSRVESGMDSRQAEAQAVEYVQKRFDDICRKSSYDFALKIALSHFAAAVTEFIISWLFHPALEILVFEMVASTLAALGVLAYLIATRAKRHWYDFAAVILFLLSWASSLVQIGIYAYHATLPNVYWTAKYIFPCVINISKYQADPEGCLNYFLANEKSAVCLNFLISVIMLAVASVLYIRQAKKRR